MAYFFINTDAKSLGYVSPHDVWFETKMAFSGDDWKYGLMLDRFATEDILLMYVREQGVAGVGKVKEPWNRKTYDKGQLVYVDPHRYKEYRIKVDWYHDFRSLPIHHSNFDFLPRSYPLNAVEKIRDEYTDQVERVIREQARKLL